MILQNYNNNVKENSDIVPLSEFVEGTYSSSTLNLYQTTKIKPYAFRQNSFIQNVYGKSVSIINEGAFTNCSKLSVVSFPNCTAIGSSAFYSCTSLSSIYLLGSSVVTLSSYNALWFTPIHYSSYIGKFGSIYVPASLVMAYRATTNWISFANRFVGV